MLSISRPNFFPGQMINYKDFNRLSKQADKMTSIICKHLYQGGGILLQALEEFDINPLKGLSVLIKPGIALLPTGYPVILSEEKVLDLGDYLSGKQSKTIIVSLKNTTKGRDRFTDEQDSSVSGYQTEAMEPEIVITSRNVPEDAVELFRVKLHPKSTTLRSSTCQEEWNLELTSPNNPSLSGIIDCRYRTSILPQTHLPMNVSTLIELRKSLYQIQESHRKISKIYLIEDPFRSIEYLNQLHAEVLSRPFQPIKVSFLISEFAEKLSYFLEHLNNRMGQQRTNYDRPTLIESIETLDRLKEKEVLPRHLSLDSIPKVADSLNRFVSFAEKKFSLLNTVEEALLDLRDRFAALDAKITLGGQLFHRVDLIKADNTDKLSVKSQLTHNRKLSTRFKSGDTLSLKGTFIKDGILSVCLDVPHPDRALVLLLHQYVRRSGSTIHYEINGKHLQTDNWEDLDLSNNWMNKGLVIPAEHLVAQDNRLKIRLEQSDLDFGFFDVAAYQPALDKGEL